MRAIVLLVAFLATACEHDPRFEKHQHVDQGPTVPAPAAHQDRPIEKTVEKPIAPPVVLAPKPVAPKPAHRKHRHH